MIKKIEVPNNIIDTSMASQIVRLVQLINAQIDKLSFKKRTTSENWISKEEPCEEAKQEEKNHS